MIYDISLLISPDLPVWPGDPAIVLEQVDSMDRGSQANVSRLEAGVHIGTHVDAPHHFMNDRRTVEDLALDVLTGLCHVTHFAEDVAEITAEALESAQIPAGTKRLLCRTRNSALWAHGEKEFNTGFVAVSEAGARWLVDHGIQLIGVDYLSVAPYHQSVPTHRVLLGAGIVVVEGLDLWHVDPGSYDLYCLPLKLAGSDGAPARAILVRT